MEGDPPPKFTWKKGTRDIPSTGRAKHVTDGETGECSLLLAKCKTPDDGVYTLTVENANGKDTVEIKLLVTTPDSGMDLRAMLKTR